MKAAKTRKREAESLMILSKDSVFCSTKYSEECRAPRLGGRFYTQKTGGSSKITGGENKSRRDKNKDRESVG